MNAAAQALKTAIAHIEHMAAWIAERKAGYSFESLGEDMPCIKAALAETTANEARLCRIKEILDEAGQEGAAAGWRSCTGCHETEDGHSVGHYPYSKTFDCETGSGCSECGGIGVVWEYHSAQDLKWLQNQLENPDGDLDEDEPTINHEGGL